MSEPVPESSPSPSLRHHSVKLADTASPVMDHGQDEPIADAPIRESSVSSTLNQTVLDIVDTAGLATNTDDEDSMSLDTASPKQQNTQIHVELRPLPSHLRAQYVNTQSDIVERVIQEEVLENGEVKYHVEFTDGREEQVCAKFSAFCLWRRTQMHLASLPFLLSSYTLPFFNLSSHGP